MSFQQFVKLKRCRFKSMICKLQSKQLTEFFQTVAVLDPMGRCQCIQHTFFGTFRSCRKCRVQKIFPYYMIVFDIAAAVPHKIIRRRKSDGNIAASVSEKTSAAGESGT